jgi:hypothetical protein
MVRAPLSKGKGTAWQRRGKALDDSQIKQEAAAAKLWMTLTLNRKQQ